jgi:heme a synthase
MLHKFAKLVAGCTVLLVLAGSLVTSTGSGLSVPDWPTSYGWNMFTFPPSKWVGGILYEHGHRLIASTVGFLTIVLVAWLWVQDQRRWLKWLGVTALLAVIAQGVLGGLTVLFFLPPAVSTAHAGLAEIFLCLVVAVALFTSPGWIHGYRYGNAKTEDTIDRVLRRVATATTAVIYGQILLGATMRHAGAGLAIPDFPLMFGHVWPTHWDSKIAIHFSHRVGALVVVLAVLVTAHRIWIHHRSRIEFTRPAALITALVAIQIPLGAFTVLSARNVWINSLHVVCGALILATSLVLALRSWRSTFVNTVQLKRDTATVAGYREPIQTKPDTAYISRSVRFQPDRDTTMRPTRTDRGVRV